jgi:hypothetical protein
MNAPHRELLAHNLAQSIHALDWGLIAEEMEAYGCARLPALLPVELCQAIASAYPQDKLFRSRVVMERHGFGRGEYKCFSYPLPHTIQQMRTAFA